MRLRFGILSLLFILIGAQASVHAQQPVAASVQIIYAGVQLQRANTEEWLPLPVGAQAPFGIGDTLRTDKTGRALITFAEAAETLLLPGSDYRLVTFDQNADQKVTIELDLLAGRSIQFIVDETTLDSYTLGLEHMTITKPTWLFATQVQPDSASDVIVGQGTLMVSKNDTTISLESGSAIRAMDTLGEIRPITAPEGFSFLSVTSKTCYGLANATLPGEESVTVRIGPAEDYLNLGNIPNGTQIPIVGQMENGKRYLTPFLSGYGWVIANGIKIQSCDNIPIVPAEAQIINGVINPEPFEMDLLTPFFGTPAQNVQFYNYQ